MTANNISHTGIKITVIAIIRSNKNQGILFVERADILDLAESTAESSPLVNTRLAALRLLPSRT
jgi:hypothetical protein